MKDDGFANKIKDLQAGINELQQRIEHLQSGLSQKDALQEALEELRNSLEELHVAEEEMRRQNELLAIAHLKIKAEQQRYQDLFDFAPDSYLLTDPNGTILEANQAAALLLNVRSDFLVRKPLVIFLAREQHNDLHDKLIKLRNGANIPSWEVLLRPRDGPPVPVLVSVSLARNESGQDGLRWLLHDITQRKKAEEELRVARDDLERRVKERTFELEAKNAEMERFVYTVSHDLRSPLITIQGFIGYLENDLKKGDERQVQNDLSMIADAVTRMDRLLSETLDMSRIGRVTSPAEDVPFEEIVREALSQSEEKIRSSGTLIKVGENLPAVHADRMRIVEALVNLIENSIKYRGEEGPAQIEIGWQEDNGMAAFFFRDNGIGVDPSQHEKIFGLFYKVNKNSEGTGAGLTIVKRIIDVNGGRIWIDSGVGKGCTIWFTLPVAEESMDRQTIGSTAK